MKKVIQSLLLATCILASTAQAAQGAATSWDKAPDKSTDMGALQHGAKLFVNYCLNCHSAAYMRFNRLTDIGLTEQQIKDYLLFTTDKVGQTMKASIEPAQAEKWFGSTPPDLTLMARSRSGPHGSGADYLYTYLRTYYRDDSKATGWNNLAFPNVAMPHVMHELQGERRPVFEIIKVNGHDVQTLKGWEQVKPGRMSAQEYDEAVADLVNFMQWMAEPGQKTRVRVGVWVMLFLLIFLIAAWRLNASYWKDVR